MKCTGELKTINLDYVSRKPQITLEVEADAKDLEALSGAKLSIELKRYRKHRSLEANSYYWALCTQIAEAVGQSVPYTHNLLLRRYGQSMTIGEKVVLIPIPDTDEASAQVDEAEEYHLKPTSEVKQGNDGVMYRTYIMQKGSHEFDTKEMSRLIDGTISEAKELGIETITENEKLEMMEVYGKKHNAES